MTGFIAIHTMDGAMTPADVRQAQKGRLATQEPYEPAEVRCRVDETAAKICFPVDAPT